MSLHNHHHSPSTPPPPLRPYWFYSSPLPIDDPLSPLPTAPPTSKLPPRPFSRHDSTVLEAAYQELLAETQPIPAAPSSLPIAPDNAPANKARAGRISFARSHSHLRLSRQLSQSAPKDEDPAPPPTPPPVTSSSVPKQFIPEMSAAGITPHRNPFIRSISQARAAASDPPSTADSGRSSRRSSFGAGRNKPKTPEPADEVEEKEIPVGVQRLHKVLLPSLVMQPIYWSPLNDVAQVVRGTWFYKETMLPVETEVANRLEEGWGEVRAWSEEWEMELASAVEVGREGEEKVRWKLWGTAAASPVSSRPGSAANILVGGQMMEREDTEYEGEGKPGKDEVQERRWKENPWDWVLFADARNAYICRDSMLSFGNKRPLAQIRRGRPVGTHVVRGFDEREWLKLHPSKKRTTAPAKKKEGEKKKVEATAEEGDGFRAGGNVGGFTDQADEGLGVGDDEAERGKVTDLILVIHGIGQKISERIESFHFTHAVNSLRRHMNLELRTEAVSQHIRPGAGIMALPVNWRHKLTFDDGIEGDADPTSSDIFTLDDITPHSIPAVRGLVGDILLDIPYYLSQHKPKMIAAVITEANRVYRLWLKNNPGFEKTGRVHILAHSLGTALAMDILSKQPTYVPQVVPDPAKRGRSGTDPEPHFLFNTHNLFLCGSPAAFFLLLNRRKLLPRAPPSLSPPDPTYGTPGTYGCMAIRNLYNILHYSDPIAYRLNPCVDAHYAATLRTAYVPTTHSSLFSSFSSSIRYILPYAAGGTTATPKPQPPATPRLPSNVELETHDFGREEMAERRLYALNENGQVDWYLNVLRPLENQYLNMLGAHSSYWESADFARLCAVECGRAEGKVVESMKVKKRRGWGGSR